jgi:hypothetical protein
MERRFAQLMSERHDARQQYAIENPTDAAYDGKGAADKKPTGKKTPQQIAAQEKYDANPGTYSVGTHNQADYDRAVAEGRGGKPEQWNPPGYDPGKVKAQPMGR